MSYTKIIRHLLLLMAISMSSSAFAGYIDYPFSAGIGVGGVGVPVAYDFVFELQSLGVSGVTAGTGFLPVPLEYRDPGLEMNLRFGMTSLRNGCGAQLEIIGGALDFEQSAPYILYVDEAGYSSTNYWAAVLNFTYHSLASEDHNADLPGGFYFSVGGGIMELFDFEGSVNGWVSSIGASTDLVLINFNDYDTDLLLVGRIEVGADYLLTPQILVTGAFTLSYVFESNDNDYGAATVYEYGTNITSYAQQMRVNTPSFFIVGATIGASYLFGGI